MDTTYRSGARDGLAAIVPASREHDQHARPTPIDEVLQDLIHAGLDALQAVMPLDLCAYLHQSTGESPQLYLRAPTMATITANEAFLLFGALGRLLDDERIDDTVPIGAYSGVAVSTSGTVSRGLHAVGRRFGSLDDREQATAERLCRSVGAASHHLEAGGRALARPTAVRVTVQLTDGVARAAVTVAGTSGPGTGQAEAPTPAEAVALAAIVAAGSPGAVREVREVSLDGRDAVLVLVGGEAGSSGEAGPTAVGSALCGDDRLQAIAGAALEAAGAVERGAAESEQAGPVTGEAARDW